jgi:hypothetical protein
MAARAANSGRVHPYRNAALRSVDNVTCLLIGRKWLNTDLRVDPIRVLQAHATMATFRANEVPAQHVARCVSAPSYDVRR